MAHGLIALHAPHVHAVAVQGLAGQPLAVGVVLVAAGAWLWHHEHHFQRFTLWLFTAGTASLTVADPAFLGALAGEVGTGPGLTCLFVAIFTIGVTWWLVAVRSHKKSRLAKMLQGRASEGGGKALALLGGGTAPRANRYKRIGSALIAISAGPLFVLVYGMWQHLLKQASTSAAGAAAALLQSSHRVSDGQAAASVPPSHRPEILLIAVILFVVAGLAMRHHEKRKHGQQGRGGRGRQPQRGGFPSIPAGGSS
jgi:hypothetical protein